MKRIISIITAAFLSVAYLSIYSDYSYQMNNITHAETDSQGNEYTEITKDNITFWIYDEYAVVHSCDTKARGDIIIPDTISNVPVTIIDAWAFENCSQITSVYVSDNVRFIGMGAFDLCEKLSSIVLPDSLVTIEDFSFNFCTNLLSVNIPDSVNAIGDYAFNYCESLESVTIPDSVERIGERAFNNTAWLDIKRNEKPMVIINNIVIDGNMCSGDVYIPDNVKSISGSAFAEAYSLESIRIPESVNEIGSDSITAYSHNLKYIKVDEYNHSYMDIDGVLYTKDKTKLLAYPAAKEGESFDIPNSVEEIEAFAFSGNRNLKTVVIPNSITKIKTCTFKECDNLESVIIPYSVTDLSTMVFSCCQNLKSITICNPECDIFEIDDQLISNGYKEDGYTPFYNGVICGYQDSTAYSYAEKYGYDFIALDEMTTTQATTYIGYTSNPNTTQQTFLIVGDANGDGNIDMSDVVMVMQACLNPKKYGVNGTSEDRITAEGEKAGDVNEDGLDLTDALLIQKYTLNLIKLTPEYEPGKIDVAILGEWATDEKNNTGNYEFLANGNGSVRIDSSSIFNFENDSFVLSDTFYSPDEYTYVNGHFEFSLNNQNFLIMDKIEGDKKVLDGTYIVTDGALYEAFQSNYANTDEYEFQITINCDKSEIYLKNCFTYSADGKNICFDKGAELFYYSVIKYTVDKETLSLSVGTNTQVLKKVIK